MAKKKKPKVNQSEVIRNVKAEHPDWTAKQIAEEVSRMLGKEIATSYVANRLSVSRLTSNSFGRREHRGGLADSDVQYSGKILHLAKTLIEETGGGEEAKQSIDFITRLIK